VGYGYPGYGWLDANDPGYDSGYDPGYDSGYDPGNASGYGDNGSYDVGPYQDGSGVAAEGYEAPGGEQASGAEELPVPYAAEGAEPGSGNAVGVARSSSVARTASVERASPDARSSSVAQPSLFDNDAVTLIFKDGRAPEKIYNYALTRTTLYVTDAKRQEIPISALDLAATEKVNRAAGVRFQLPVTQ
jgi:hypothetical protein